MPCEIPTRTDKNDVFSADSLREVNLTWNEVSPSALRLSFTATRTIHVGQELFWGDHTGRLAYEAADRLVEKLWTLANRHSQLTQVQWVGTNDFVLIIFIFLVVLADSAFRFVATV